MRALSNLPPGVTVGMIEAHFAEPPPPPKCRWCGGFLRWDPDTEEPWEDAFYCDGATHSYEETYSDGMVAILGDEYRGQTYTVHYTDCGLERRHGSHREIVMAGLTECRRCGAWNGESLA